MDTSHTENDLEMKQEVKERKLHRMAKVEDFLEMWQGTQILRATEKQFHAHNKMMTPVGYIMDREKIVKASWSLLQHDGVAAFTLSDRSPLPPALSATEHPLRMNLNINCLQNQMNQLSFSRTW